MAGASRARLRLPRRTVRLRLTLLYGGLFLLCAVVLLALTNLVVRGSAADKIFVASQVGGGQVSQFTSPTALPPALRATIGPASSNPVLRAVIKASQSQLRGTQRQLRHVISIAASQPASENHTLLLISVVGLGVMAVVSIWLGWLVAGRVLEPLRTITAAAREISASDLHRRLALSGPDDELRELGDTFDELLARLEASFEAQRQFVANASHELRTPLARQRTLAEVALSDPNASVESLHASYERLIAAGEQQERLIEALLTLARSERGLAEREPFDLAELTAAVLASRRAELRRRRLALDVSLAPAPASGHPRLAERLIANLIDNAIIHNRRGGSVRVATSADLEHATITVANSGTVIDPAQVDRLLEPFQRLGAARSASAQGTGLGLSIAAAIARAHGGRLALRSQPEGGLVVEAIFPRASHAVGDEGPPAGSEA